MRIHAFLLLAAASSLLVGCAGTTSPPDIMDVAYQGPALTLEQRGGLHVVVAQTPSPGWTFKLDRLFDGYRHQGAYVSLTQPNPAFSYAQVMVEQRLATSVLASQPIRVYARVADFMGEAPTGDGYALAASSETGSSPAAPQAPSTPTRAAE